MWAKTSIAIMWDIAMETNGKHKSGLRSQQYRFAIFWFQDCHPWPIFLLFRCWLIDDKLKTASSYYKVRVQIQPGHVILRLHLPPLHTHPIRFDLKNTNMHESWNETALHTLVGPASHALGTGSCTTQGNAFQHRKKLELNEPTLDRYQPHNEVTVLCTTLKFQNMLVAFLGI